MPIEIKELIIKTTVDEPVTSREGPTDTFAFTEIAGDRIEDSAFGDDVHLGTHAITFEELDHAGAEISDREIAEPGVEDAHASVEDPYKGFNFSVDL